MIRQIAAEKADRKGLFPSPEVFEFRIDFASMQPFPNLSRDPSVTEKSSKSDVTGTHASDNTSTHSDFMHYLGKTTKIPMAVKTILFTALMVQWTMASLCPSYTGFWRYNPSLEKIMSVGAYVCLIKPPPIASPAFLPILITIFVIVGIEALLSCSMQLYYSERRYLNTFSCYILVYLDLLVHALLFPFICAISGMYLSASFLESEDTSPALAVIDLIVFVYVVADSIAFHLFMNFTASWNEMMCFTWRQDVSVRFYVSLGFITFLSEAMTKNNADMRILAPIVCAIALGNMLCEMIQINWLIDWQFRLMGSAALTCFMQSTLLVINAFILSWNKPSMVVWIGIVVFLAGWLLLPAYLRLMTQRASRALWKDDYPEKVSSCFRALRDHSLGFQSAHENVMNCKHILALLEKYPKNVNLYIFLARLSLECNTCPITLDEIADRILPHDAFAPIQTHAFVSLTRLMPPMSDREMENYNKLVMTIRHGLFRLLGAARHVFDMILDEITSTLPPATLSFEAIYKKTIFRLFQFVQRYPGSPDGEYFLSLLENLLPDSPELRELKQWQNYHPDYLKIATSVCHSHMYSRLKQPDSFRSYHPYYQTPRGPEVDPLVCEQAEEDDTKKLEQTRGPYEHLVRKWYVYVILAIGLLLPVILVPIMIVQNQRFLDKTTHFVDAWAMRWRLDRIITLTYPAVFYASSNETWNQFSAGLMDYDTWKARFLYDVKDVQADFFQVSTGFGSGGTVDKSVMEEFSTFFSKETTSHLIPGSFSYAHGILATTFIIDEIMSGDAVYLSSIDNATYLIGVLDEAADLITECFGKGEYLFTNNIVFDDKLFSVSAVVLLVIMLVALIASLGFIAIMFYKALSRSNLFFMTLRETSKSAVAHVRSYFLKQQDFIGTTITAKQKMIKKRIFRYYLDFLVPFLIICFVMIACLVLSFSLYNCFNDQLSRIVNFNEVITNAYVNLSRSARNHQKIFFADTIGNVNTSELSADIQTTFRYWMPFSKLWGDDGTTFCPFCTLRMQQFAPVRDGTFERIFMDWISGATLYVTFDVEPTLLDEIATNVSSSYYFETESVMIEFYDQLFLASYDNVHQTQIYEYAVFIVYLLMVVCMVVLFVATVTRADAPFRQMVRLLNRLPDKSLSRDTMRILREDFWDFQADEFEFDPSYYDKVLSILPDAVIVIDQTRTILSYNEAAENLLSTKGETAVGRSLFESMKMKLTEANENGTNEPSLGFQDLVNDYLFDDRSTVPTHKLIGKKDNQSYWWSLTILPVFDESPDQVVSQLHGAENFALIFRDIGDEIRQQNLLEEETEKHMSIVKQILPPEIAARLLTEQRSISMTVEKVAISFCDIVEFTPWCASQTPEFVVNALNCMFKKFDDLCMKYSQVTKIKCIGDCYMSAAGVFAHGVDPSVAAHQMILFCLDSIEGIKAVNQVLNTTLRVRIGIAYGGPISAGVMGIHKPVFDIWGETVNEAQAMESSGEPMKVHISQAMYEVVKDSPCSFVLRDDGTALVTREPIPEPVAVPPPESAASTTQHESESESVPLLDSDEL